ncbi:MAG: hypothetical protein C1O27_002463 [Chloroflexi bacterium]|jgi:hypothetical protein|nr:MAG: hypothetical protein C1O27_002463 [Chloroflexota bacterium]
MSGTLAIANRFNDAMNNHDVDALTSQMAEIALESTSPAEPLHVAHTA